MLRLRLPEALVKRLHSALQAAGTNEVGGVLVGEHVAENTFHLVDLSVQTTSGNHVCFVRLPAEHTVFIEAFHARTGHDYARFNYLGEWHSHPSFPVAPSTQDAVTMQAIVDDETEPAQFAVLLIARLDRPGQLRLAATVFQAGLSATPVHLEVEGHAVARVPRLGRAAYTVSASPRVNRTPKEDFHD